MMSRDESYQSREASWRILTESEELMPFGKQCHVFFPSGVELVLLDFVSLAHSTHTFFIDKSLLEFSFHLQGCSQGILQDLKKQEIIAVSPGISVLSFCPQSEWETRLLEQQRYRILNIYIPPDFFWKKFGQQLDQLPRELLQMVESGSCQPYHQLSSMSSHITALVEELFHCPYQGAMRQLYLASKAMEIILRYIWELAGEKHANSCLSLSGSSEREQIHGARQILMQNLSNPPSLATLARKVGMNPNKLNQGFRQEFGMTVFAWYRMTRIQRSCELLQQGQLNIDETAQSLGFHDTPHFIRHFKKHFGKTPGRYLKERKI